MLSLSILIVILRSFLCNTISFRNTLLFALPVTMRHEILPKMKKARHGGIDTSNHGRRLWRHRFLIQKLFEIPGTRRLLTTLFWIVVIGAAVMESILLFRNVVPPPGDDYGEYGSIDYGEVLTEEDEFRQIFNLIDTIQDGLLTLQEFEAFALFRFRGHTPNSELDEFGIGRPPQNTVENSIIEDAFLNKLDLNGDTVLTDEELTTDNVKILFNKAKEVMEGFDIDNNQLVTWDEFLDKIGRITNN